MTDASFSQRRNGFLPTLFNFEPLAMLTVVKSAQDMNAMPAMLVTLAGMLTVVKPGHLTKASWMVVTPDGMV